LDVWKVHKQTNVKLVPRFEHENLLKVMYSGYSKTVLKMTIASSTFFPLFDTFQEHKFSAVVSAIFSSVIATTMSHTAEYLKTRQMCGLELFQGWNYFKDGIHSYIIKVFL